MFLMKVSVHHIVFFLLLFLQTEQSLLFIIALASTEAAGRQAFPIMHPSLSCSRSQFFKEQHSAHRITQQG